MIGYLRGEVLEHSDGKVLMGVSVGTGMVGYAVTVPQSPAYLSFMPGSQAEVYVYTHVREDALDLYGFATRVEKELFLTLLSVNGIGPKGAMGILSKVETEQLIQAILNEDKESLIQIPGIGKKTAERVVMELADPIRKKMEAGAFGETRPAPTTANAKASSGATSGRGSALIQDAKAALVGLGYRENDVAALLNRVIAEMETPPSRTEDLIKTALRQLA